MWGSSSVHQKLMHQPVTIPISIVPTSRPFSGFSGFSLPSNDFHNVMEQWHLQTAGLSSLASITRVLGYLLVITTSGLQIPHIVKVLKSRRCDGVSLLSTAILLHSSSSNVAYCIYRNFPLSMWAESMPLMAQYITLMCLLLLYRGRQRNMLFFVLLYVMLMLPLLLGVVPGYIVSYLKVMTLPLTLLGKVNHIYDTFKRGGTGQHSKSSVFLLNLRSGGRLLTSLFDDTRDSLLVLCYAHACFWNTLITCQTVYYAHKKRRRMREERKRRERDGGAVGGGESENSGSGSGSSSYNSSSDSDTTSDSEIPTELQEERFPRRRRRCNSFMLNGGVMIS